MRRPDAPLHGSRSSVRAATDADAELLAAWHADPEVSRYWNGRSFTPEEIRARLTRPHVDAYVVEAGDEPVGYLQAWFADDGESGGLDMFLIPSARGRGIGPDAAAALASFLRDVAGLRRVAVDPYAWNERAVAGWKKAGFRAIEERPADDEHPHAWLLMEFG